MSTAREPAAHGAPHLTARIRYHIRYSLVKDPSRATVLTHTQAVAGRTGPVGIPKGKESRICGSARW